MRLSIDSFEKKGYHVFGMYLCLIKHRWNFENQKAKDGFKHGKERFTL